jgi:cobalt-zinc-cadmium efflux system protein
MWVAGVAVVVNTLSALLFLSGRGKDMNVRSAFLHLAGDAALALGVVATGAIVEVTGFFLLDPIVSLVLSALIVMSTWSLLRGSINLALDAVPEGIDPVAVRDYLVALPGVREVHDLHIWAMSTTETALTAHLVITGSSGSRFLGDACKELHDRFGIEHSTLQVEPEDAPDPCRLAPDEMV